MIKASDLKSLVDSCKKILGKTDEPVVGLKTSGGAIEVFATGGTSSVSMSHQLEGPGSGSEFLCSVYIEEFSKILDGCGASDIGLSIDGTALKIVGAINAKLSTSTNVPRMSADVSSGFLVDAKWFRNCCVMTKKFAAKERGTYIFNSAHFEFVDTAASFCAAQYGKMVWSETACEKVQGENNIAINIPREYADVLSSIIPPVDGAKIKVEFGPSCFRVEMGDISSWSVMLEGQFPDWRSVRGTIRSTAPIDAPRLAKVSEVMEALGVERARFVCDGKQMQIYGKSIKVPEFDTKLDAHMEPIDMMLSPAIIAGSTLDKSSVHFGWGSSAFDENEKVAFLIAPPFTAMCMQIGSENA
jgi:hypothetical protein